MHCGVSPRHNLCAITRRLERRHDWSNGMSGQERKNKTRDLVVLLVQGEMASVEEMDLGVRQIALERLAAWTDERRIVPPPDHQRWWPVLTQPRLPRRIRSNVRLVVVEQIRLDLVLPGPR